MKLSFESIQEFMAIYNAEHETQLSYVEAEEIAAELLSFYSLISK